MIKLIRRRGRLLLLASVMLGAIFGSLHNSVTMAQHGPEEPIYYEGSGDGGGGGGYSCPDAATCGNFGCHPRSIADPTQVCSRYKLQANGPECPSPVNCS
jgi:hypothetical protein